jgi:hypothetical protein
MGHVYEAENLALGKRVAIKFLHVAAQSEPSSLARFQREARAISAVESDHVVKVFDWGQDDERAPFLVMEMLEGRDLAARIAQHGPMDVEEAVHVAVEAVVHQAVVLPPILGQKSARRRLAIAQSALLNIVSVTRVSNPLRKVNKMRLIMVILVQMLQLKFAVRDTARTRSNVLRMLPDGVMQQQHMRAR